MLNITNHYGNANQNHNEISPHVTWMATIKNKQTTENEMCWQGCGGTGTLRHCWECKMVQLIRKIVWWLLEKFSIKLSSDPESPLLGIYPKELKSGTWRDICTLMFMAAWFTVGPRWGLRQWKICLQCRRPGFSPWVGKIPWRKMPTHSSILTWRIPWREVTIHGVAKSWTRLS